MAFYPGETFSHEPMPQSDFSVEGMIDVQKNQFDIKIISHKQQEFVALPADLGEQLEFELEQLEEPIKVDYENRLETKSRIKRRLYALLVLRTGRLLPWGTLTGIRPTKIIMTKLQEGASWEEIVSYMKNLILPVKKRLLLL